MSARAGGAWLVAAAMFAAVWLVAAAPAVSVAAASSCRSYPRPGTTARGPAPALMRAQYRALRRPRDRADRIAVARLGRLPESGILPAGTRMLGRLSGGGRAYLVASLHLLAAPMRPVRCVAPAQRARQAALLATLRHEYAHQGLCLVIIYARGRRIVNCGAAPGTVAALVPTSSATAVGIAPDGIRSVVVSLRGGRRPLAARVRDNLWSLTGIGGRAAPCGLRWRAAAGTVLRTVRSCTADLD